MRKRTRKPNGQGSIFKTKSGDWRGYVTIGYDSKNRQIKKWVNAKTQDEALKRLDSIRHLSASTYLHFDYNITLSDWLNQYAQQRALSVRSKTTQNHHDFIKRIPSWLSKKRLRDINHTNLQHFYNFLTTDGLTYSYRLQIHHFVKAALEAAKERGILLTVPSADLPTGDIKPVAKTWSSEQVATFLAGASGHRLYLLFRLMLERGLRLGEALALQWQDLTGDTLHIRRTMSVVKEGVTFNLPKSKRGLRSFNLSSDYVALLGSPGPKGAPIFTNLSKKHYHPDNVRLSFKRLTERLGLPQIRVHDLRHTFITLAREQNIPVEMVAYIAGQDVKTTLSIYSQATPSRVRAACEQINIGGTK